jgi:hypothetical protein
MSYRFCKRQGKTRTADALEKGHEMRKLTNHSKTWLALGLLLFGLFGTALLSSALEVGDKFRGKKLVLLEFYGADFAPV